MTRLEQEIERCMIDNRFDTLDNQVRAAAEVAKKYIEKAFDAGVDATDSGEIIISRPKWLKENGITE